MDFIEILLKSIFVIAFYVLVMEIYWRSQKNYLASKILPNVPGYFHIGNLLNVCFSNQQTIFADVRRWSKMCKKTYCMYGLGQFHLVVISAPEVEQIMSTAKHTDKSMAYLLLESFLKDGLLTSKGEKYFHRRKILTPAFHFDILEQFMRTFREKTEMLYHQLLKITENSNEIDVIPLASNFALTTICETALGVKIEDTREFNIYRKNIHLIGRLIIYRMFRIIFHNRVTWFLTGLQWKQDKLLRPVHLFTTKIINQRREIFYSSKSGVVVDENQNEEPIQDFKKRRHAMLDTLLEAEALGLIDDQGIREEVDTFTFEGHDTTSCCVIFTLLLLAHHPEAQDKILEELKEAREANSYKELSIEDIKNMKFLDRVFKEVLRLYPPVHYISRELTDDLQIGKATVQKGTIAHVLIYDLHRDPEYFPDPEKFDPDRFLPENVENRHPYCYIPFSAGRRNCIGQKFAALEIKVVMLKIIENFILLPVTKREDIVFVADIILRSRDPIKVKFQKRNP